MINSATIAGAMFVGTGLLMIAFGVATRTHPPTSGFVMRDNDLFGSPIINNTGLPIELAGNSFIFPAGWTQEMADKWRAEHNAALRPK